MSSRPKLFYGKRRGHVLITVVAFASLCFALGRLSCHGIGNSSTPPSPRLSLSPLTCNELPSGKAFDDIYRTGYWSNFHIADITPKRYYTYGDTTSRPALSGPGSNTGPNTRVSLNFLATVIANYSVRTILDIPCGDVNWQMDAYEVDTAQLYVGADVVPSVVQLNRKRFKYHSNKRFVLWDLAQCPLPRVMHDGKEQPFDLIHTRDVLQHLKLKDAARAAHNLLHSGASLLVANTYPAASNVNIPKTGLWYSSNLEKPPFNFPKPILCVPTHPFHEPDLSCLYKLR